MLSAEGIRYAPSLSAHHHARLIARRFSAARFHYLRGRYRYRQLQHLCFIHQSGPATAGGGAFVPVTITNSGSAQLVINYSFSNPAFAFVCLKERPP